MLLNKNTLFSSFNTLFFLLKGKKVLLIAMDITSCDALKENITKYDKIERKDRHHDTSSVFISSL